MNNNGINILDTIANRENHMMFDASIASALEKTHI